MALFNANIKDQIENIIEENLFNYIISEHNIAQDKGSDTRRIVELFSLIINTKELKELNDKHNFFRAENPQEKLKNYLNFIKGGLEFYFFNNSKLPFPDKSFTNIKNDIIKCNEKKCFFIPFGLETRDDNYDIKENHCMSMVINILSPKSTFEVYFLNSGGSTVYHNSKVDYTLKIDSIIKKTVNKEILTHFLYFACLSKNTLEFYNSAMSLIEQKSVYVKNGTKYVELVNELNDQDTYYEAQTVGSCSFRSIVLSTLTYMRFINKQIINDFNAFYVMIKLLVIKGFYEWFNEHLSIDAYSNGIYIKHNQLFFFTRDIYKEIKLKLQTDNTDIMDSTNLLDVAKISLIDSINLKEQECLNTIQQYLNVKGIVPKKIINEPNPQIPVLPPYGLNEQSTKTKDLLIDLTDPLPIENYINTFYTILIEIGYLPLDPEITKIDPAILKYYYMNQNLLSHAIYFDTIASGNIDKYPTEIQNGLNGYIHSGQVYNPPFARTTNRTNFAKHYEELFNYLYTEAYNGYSEILNPYILRFFIGLNEYFRNFFADRIEKSNRNSYFHSVYFNKMIPSHNIYELFNFIVTTYLNKIMIL